nr:MAG TPA: hypothetical protein [Caudoviricetes sp.]
MQIRLYTTQFYQIKLYRYPVVTDLRIIDMFHTFRIPHQIQRRPLFRIMENFRMIVQIQYRESGLPLLL